MSSDSSCRCTCAPGSGRSGASMTTSHTIASSDPRTRMSERPAGAIAQGAGASAGRGSHGRAAITPGRGGLEGAGRGEHGAVGVATADDLEPHRKTPVGAEPHGHAGRGLARQVERIRERHPAQHGDRLARRSRAGGPPAAKGGAATVGVSRRSKRSRKLRTSSQYASTARRGDQVVARRHARPACE